MPKREERMPDEAVRSARARAYSTPLDQFHVADAELFRTDSHWPWFERLRREDPVHYCAQSEYGPYWSVTKHRDIIAIDGNHRVFSPDSELGGIAIVDGRGPRHQSSFIALDPPRHSAPGKVIARMFSPQNMAALGPPVVGRRA